MGFTARLATSSRCVISDSCYGIDLNDHSRRGLWACRGARGAEALLNIRKTPLELGVQRTSDTVATEEEKPMVDASSKYRGLSAPRTASGMVSRKTCSAFEQYIDRIVRRAYVIESSSQTLIRHGRDRVKARGC